MRLAICDGDLNFTSRIKTRVYSYAEDRELDIVVDCFTSGEQLLTAIQYYNIICLGYNLSGINGMETAERLRSRQITSEIIFISEHADFIFEAFKVSAFRFLLKSNWEGEIASVLDDCILASSSHRTLLVKCGTDEISVNTEDIYYLEADNKHCLIHLKKEVLSCNQTMARVYSFLPKNYFSKTNRAYVVNLDYISRYNPETIIMKNGKSLHPSRNYYKSFREEYRRFLMPYVV